MQDRREDDEDRGLKARYQNMHEVVADLEEYQATFDPAVAEARAFAQKYEPQEFEGSPDRPDHK